MSPLAELQRHFTVHACDDVRERGQPVEGLNFQDAALAFVEHHHPQADADGDVALLVEDCETGERQCFVVDVRSGETEACA